MGNDFKWRSANGVFLAIKDMKDSHLLRTWQLIIRYTTEAQHIQKGRVLEKWGHSIYTIEYLIEAEHLMHKELVRRNSQIPHFKGLPHHGLSRDIGYMLRYKKDPSSRNLSGRWEDPMGFIMSGLRGLVHCSDPRRFTPQEQWRALQAQLALLANDGAL